MSVAPVYQVAQIRELEHIAFERFHLSADVLMERAGQAALRWIETYMPGAKRLALVCGPGNNGGDGYVLARLAKAAGYTVQVWHAGHTHHLKDAGLKAYEACLAAGIEVPPFLNHADLLGHDLIVDAIYGIGFKGEMQHESQLAIQAMNQSHIPILALDVPSGVDANTGAVLTQAVHAKATLSFLGLKLGLMTGQGVNYAGDVYCDTLQVPEALFSLVPSPVETLDINQYKHFLKPRPRDTHKGDAGHVLIVGGAPGFSGAVRMAAEAALRVGAGLVSVATHPSHAAFLNLTRPEIMVHGVRSGSGLKSLLRKASVVVIGPGLGVSRWGKNLLTTVLKTHHPLIVDADGLNQLAHKDITRSNWILTPHPGEAARLLKTTTDKIQQHRYQSLHEIQTNYGGVVVLKGAGSLVAAPHHLTALCTQGNPGMASAGMGDVLSGVLAGLVAQGVPLAESAQLGVCLHAMAGDAAARAGERGTLAMDLMPYLRQWVN